MAKAYDVRIVDIEIQGGVCIVVRKDKGVMLTITDRDDEEADPNYKPCVYDQEDEA